jgi:hypothetical protein
VSWPSAPSRPPLFGSAFRAALRLTSRLGRYHRAFTNIGSLDGPLADWDGVPATNIFVLTPLSGAPRTIITGSGSAGRVTIAVGYDDGWLTDSQLDTLHQTLRDGLQLLATAAPTMRS